MTMIAVLSVLITLCICNALILMYGINRVCKTIEHIKAPRTEAPVSAAPDVSPEEMDRARRQFNAEMEAFQELMNYNSDTAYGIKRTED